MSRCHRARLADPRGRRFGRYRSRDHAGTDTIEEPPDGMQARVGTADRHYETPRIGMQTPFQHVGIET